MSFARKVSYQILFNFEQQKERLDILFANSNLDELDARDRRFAGNLVSGTVRHLLYFDWLIQQLYSGKFSKLLLKIKTILRLALYELQFLDSIPERASVNEYVLLTKKVVNPKSASLVNAILRNYLRKKKDLDNRLATLPLEKQISIKYSFPMWLVERWIKSFGLMDTENLCISLNTPPNFDLKINTKQISIENFISLLESNSITFRKSKLFENVVTVENIQPVIEAGWLQQGLCSVQDESAAIPVSLLNPTEEDTVLDVCAAPGGKFIQILECKPKLAVAIDSDYKRLKRVKENAQRLNYANGLFICADARYLPLKKKFSKVLLDVPCSGLGVIRKHPDIKWRRKFEEIVEFSEIQSHIIDSSLGIVQDQGKLAYSTCTIEKLENKKVVENFLNKNSEKVILIKPDEKYVQFGDGNYIQCLPHKHQTDGSFCSIIQKK